MKIRILSVLMAVGMLVVSVLPTVALAKDKENQEGADVSFEIEYTTSADLTQTTESTAKEDKNNKKDKDKKEPKKDPKKVQEELEKQQAELEANLAEAEKKLAELEKTSKVKEEYIDTLDQKIGYINNQLTVLENKNNSIQEEIDALKPDIEKNQKEYDEINARLLEAEREYDALEKKFQSLYEAYCYRLKVMYISGDFNIISALLSCKDLSTFYTRYQMIKSVSKSDAQLLEEVTQQMNVITTKKNGIDEQKEKVGAVKKELDGKKASLVSKQKSIEANSQTIAKKKVSLATDRAECDRLLAELNAQNKQYTEFRNEDEELIQAVEKEIQDLIAGVKTSDEVTTAVAGEASGEQEAQKENDKLDVYSKSDAVLNMRYPVPSRRSISAGFPNYSSGRYHGGLDFPCPKGSKVVAAQKGIVITVKRLNYSYGYYVMIYHGTDSSGRSVVTLYAHNSSILVNVGDSVEKGDTIAKSGSTGNSTGPHCHFEVRLDGARVNPKNYLS